jgi:hypothetical protein
MAGEWLVSARPTPGPETYRKPEWRDRCRPHQPELWRETGATVLNGVHALAQARRR